MVSASDKDEYDDLSDPTFDDSDAYGDGAAALEDSWEDDTSEPATPPPKKKAKLGNLIIIGVGALLMMGVVYLQVFSGGTQRQSTAQEQQQSPQPETPPAPALEAPPGPQPQTPPQPTVTAPAAPSLGDVAVTPSVPDATAQPTDPFTPMPATSQGTSTATPPQPEVTPSQPAPEIPMIAGAKTMPDVSPTPVEAAPLQPTTASAPTATEAVVAPVSGVDESRFAALEKKLTDIQTKLEASPAAATGTVSADDLKGIAAQLDQMSRRLDALEARQETTTTAAKPAVPKNTTVETQNQPVKSTPIVRAPSVHYIFKAVAGNKAYVARAGSSTILSVAVGDSLAGMGTVQSIGQVDGKWVIRTTMGRISQ